MIDWNMVTTTNRSCGRKWNPGPVGVCQIGAGGWCVLDGSPLSKFKDGRAAGGLVGWMRALRASRACGRSDILSSVDSIWQWVDWW